MNNIGKKIIVEGIDGAGKSTYIERLIKENPQMNYKVIHCTRHTPNTYEYFSNLLKSEDNIIFDRFCFGQFVYQKRSDRKLNLQDLTNLIELMNDIKAKIIYIYSSIEACLLNCKKDSEDSYYTYNYLESLDNKFRSLFDIVDTYNIVEYYHNYYEYSTSNKESKELTEEDKTNIIKNFDYSVLPKVIAVDFDNTLFIGAKFPEIGHINKKLKYELLEGKWKDYKKVLFTNRTNGALIEACNVCADEGIYFDAVNDNIKEVKDALFGGPDKIWFDVIIDDKAINVKDI